MGGAGAGALVVVPCAWCLVTAHESVCTICRVCRAAIEGWCRSWCWYRIPTRELVCHGAPWRAMALSRAHPHAARRVGGLSRVRARAIGSALYNGAVALLWWGLP